MAAVLTAIVPDKGVRPAYNGTGGTLALGTCTKLATSPTVKNEVAAATGNTDPCYGILMKAVANLGTADVQIAGRAICVAGAAITPGVRVMPSTGGKVVTATAGNSIVGVAVTAAANDGDLIEVELGALGTARMPG